MAEQNLYVNQLLSDPVYFADLCNGILFDGRQMVTAGDLTPAKDQSGHRLRWPGWDAKGAGAPPRCGHVLKGRSPALCGCAENAANVHYAMPVRSMLYDALDYTDQVQRLKQVHGNRKIPWTATNFSRESAVGTDWSRW